MDAESFLDEVRAVREAELDRLGSEKALVAETDADLSTAAVLRSAAEAEARARDTFAGWADDEDHERAREAFVDVADRERDHYERIAAELEDAPESPVADALHEHLRGLDGTVERVAAGMVGRPLAAERTLLQVVSFFVNEADTARADLFREVRGDTEDLVGEGADLLADVCADAADWERARAAAEAVVDVVYEEYAATLSGMGIDPKPVC